MKRILKNNLGMTLVEVLLAILIFVLMIWTFAPFVAATFKQIAQAGTLHVELSEDVSNIDGQLADEFFGAPSTFPVKVGGDDNIDVNGVHLTSGQLHTFYSGITSYITTDDILYEGYGSDDFYTGFYSIGFLPEVSNKKFFKNQHTWVVELVGKDGFIYMVDEEIDVVQQDGNPPGFDKNDIDPDTVDDLSGVFIVASQFPDGAGGNPDKIAYICIVPDKYGLDNTNSPYGLVIKSKDKGQTFVDEQIPINVMLPLYQAVGEDGWERIASHIDYWVDKHEYHDPDYGDEGIDVIRLPENVDFYDVMWYEDDSIGLYITVGDDGNLWYRYHESDWIEMDLVVSGDLNRIKRLGGMFVAIGSNGTVITSNDLSISTDPADMGTDPSDPMSWGTNMVTISGTPSTKDLTAFSYNSSVGYVIMASDGTVYTSSDLSTYTEHSTAASGITDASVTSVIINDMVWMGSHFIAVGDDNYIAVSPDGTNWTILEPSSTIDSPNGFDDFNCVFVNRSQGFILGDSGQIHMIGLGGDVGSWTWTTVRAHSEGGENLYDMSYSRRAYVVVGEDGKVMYSLNGTTWTDTNKMDGFDTEKDIFAVAGRE